MFAFAEKYNTVLKVLLGLIALSFVVVGVESYSDADSPNDVARVGGEHITRQDLARYLGDKLPSPALRDQALEAAIAERIRVAHARDIGMAVSDAELAARIAGEASLQENGKFSPKLYERFLQAQSMSSSQLETRLRQDLLSQQLVVGTVGSGFMPQFNLDRYAALFGEERAVSQQLLAVEDYKSRVALPADAARKYYDGHVGEFATPEQARLEYVILSQQEQAKKIPISDADIQKFYEQNKTQLSAEQRKVRHILLSVDAKAGAADKAKVKAQADDLLKRLQQTPEKFADLARQYSQDPGSAMQGGDLGYVGRGMMVPAFDSAAFSMKKGELRGPVETQYGFHILALDDVKVQSFEEVKPQIESQLRSQKAVASFQGIVDKFSDLLYQQAGTLQAAAKEFGLGVQQSDWVSRNKAADAVLNNPKVLEAVFSDDVLKKKHNSEAIDLGNGNMVAVRVLDHRPGSTMSFEQAQSQIVAKLTLEEAKKLMQKDGQAKVVELNAAKLDSSTWKDLGRISRLNAANLPHDTVRALFKVSTAKLPAYVGVDSAEGYVVYKITDASAGTLSADKMVQLQQTLERIRLETEAKAYFGQLAARQSVEINKKNLSQMQ